jgi:predicted enzyme related to lactoylglutathione lyase
MKPNPNKSSFIGEKHMMNPVVHFEMPYRDRERAAQFYSAAFGWQAQMLGPEMGDYLLVTTAVTDARPGGPAGAINGGLFPFKPDWPAQFPSVGLSGSRMYMLRWSA